MNLLPDAEQQEIVTAAAAVLAKEDLTDAGAWPRLGALGWFGLGLPQAVGGTGYSVAEEALLFRELGRALAPGPFLAQVLAAHVGAAAGEDALAAELVSGGLRACLAEPYRDVAASAGAVVRGRFLVADVAGADVVLVVAPDGVALVEPAALGEAEAHEAVDAATSLALGRAEPTPARASLAGGAAEALVLRGQVLVAAMLAGGCEATRDESAAYAKEREQFGRPIGTFQAVKHRCADMAVRAEAATSLTLLAALSLAAGATEGPRLVRLAKALAAEYAVANAADDVQNHGGTGFTAGCPAHRYLARANLLAGMLGSPAQLYVEDLRP